MVDEVRSMDIRVRFYCVYNASWGFGRREGRCKERGGQSRPEGR